MNSIGEKIDITKAECREMYLPDLVALLQSAGMIFRSWGPHNYKYSKKMFRMNVQGHHHTGHVYIFLNGTDLFDVYLTTVYGTIKQRTHEMGIYGDTLIEWIDRKVERIPAYVR